MFPKPRHSIAAILALVVGLWATPARADVFTVDWDVVPHEFREVAFDNSPYYDCSGSHYSTRLCQWMWDTGLSLDKFELFDSFYDDRFFEGGVADLEERIGPQSGVLRIAPQCKAGLGPCFESFTPLTLTMYGYSFGPPPNLFVLSSRDGLVKTSDDSVPIVFAGSAWQDLDWIEVGFYLPSFCGDDEPPEGTEEICRSPFNDKALSIEELTFEAVPVPEPGLLSLFAAGALGVGVRRWRRS
jgi:hypothetical protein